MKNKNDTKKHIKTAAELPSIYVVIVPCTRTLKHWRGYHKYEKAVRVAAKTGGIVSSAQFLRRKFGPTKNRRTKKAA
jgi:hypothetical protein